jgi:hypothetical protein
LNQPGLVPTSPDKDIISEAMPVYWMILRNLMSLFEHEKSVPGEGRLKGARYNINFWDASGAANSLLRYKYIASHARTHAHTQSLEVIMKVCL